MRALRSWVGPKPLRALEAPLRGTSRPSSSHSRHGSQRSCSGTAMWVQPRAWQRVLDAVSGMRDLSIGWGEVSQVSGPVFIY